MKKLIEEITQGKHDGEVFWICDFRHTDFSARVDRYIKPTKVLVQSNKKTNIRINYSESHFIPFNKDESLSRHVIKIFDNTGWKSNPGIPLQVFRSEVECKQAFIKTCISLKADLEVWFQRQREIHVKHSLELEGLRRAYMDA